MSDQVTGQPGASSGNAVRGLSAPTKNEMVLFWASFMTLIAAGMGFVHFFHGQRYLRGGHQPADRDAVLAQQDPLAEYPPRRLAGRPDPRCPAGRYLRAVRRSLGDPDRDVHRADVGVRWVDDWT